MARKRMTVNLTDELVDVLKQLADINDTTVTDELRKAIQDRSYFVEKIREGNDVVLEKGTGSGAKERTNVVLR